MKSGTPFDFLIFDFTDFFQRDATFNISEDNNDEVEFDLSTVVDESGLNDANVFDLVTTGLLDGMWSTDIPCLNSLRKLFDAAEVNSALVENVLLTGLIPEGLSCTNPFLKVGVLGVLVVEFG